MKLSRTLWGSWAWKPFCVPHFLFLGNRPQPPWPSLSSKGQIPTATNHGREGRQRQGRSGQKTIVQPWSGSWFYLPTKTPNKRKMLTPIMPEKPTWGQIKGTREAHHEMNWDQVKGCRPLTQSNLISIPQLNHCHTTPAVSPFAWSFYFTGNSLSEIQFSTSAQRPSFKHQ